MPWTTSSPRPSDARVKRCRPGLFAALLAGDENPDLRIAYETATATKIEDSPVRVGVGKGSLEPPAVTAAVQAAMRDFPTRQSSD